MIQSSQVPFLWDHNLIGDIITVSFDSQRQFCVSVTTQVLKLASRFAAQNLKEDNLCLLIGSCENKSNRVNINIDRIECNLTSYLSDNQLLCTNDICVPLKIFKNKSNIMLNTEDYISSFDEYIKSFEDISAPILLSKVMLLKAYASFSSDQSITQSQSSKINWIDFKLLIPDLHLTFSPIKKLPIFRSALISSLDNSYSIPYDNALRFGYLAIDQPGKVHFLLHSDERTLTSTLVGVWVHGLSDVSDILVVTSCLKYILMRYQQHKLSKPPFSFLLAQFTEHTRDSIRFFDVKWPKAPSEEPKSLLNHISLKLLTAADNICRYYQTPNEKANSFTMTLSPVATTHSTHGVVNNAFKMFIANNYDSKENDDNIPRVHGSSRNSAQVITPSEYQGLEVSDVSLLVNEVSTHSSASSNSHDDYQHNNTNLLLSAYTTEVSASSNPKSHAVHSSKVHNDEAMPRPLLRKQHPTPLIVPRNEIPEQRYHQVQYIPQPMFPYPAIYPSNAYMMLPPNMYMPGGQDHNPQVKCKPPQRPRPTESSVAKKPSKATRTMKNEGHSKITVSGMNNRVDGATITDVTNTSSKRVLQLDREEDLATLEVLVQQIINQRHQNKPTMVSRGVNTSAVFVDRPNIIEVSTDLPSFLYNPVCSRCQQALDNQVSDNGSIDIRDTIDHIASEIEDKENSFTSIEFASYVKPNEITEGQTEDTDQQPWFGQKEDSAHYSDLLNNLEEFVKQSRNSVIGDNPDEEILEAQCKENEPVSQLNILEDAVQNLRELDLNHDVESQYWETMRNTATNDSSLYIDRDSLDATILQQKINYVSIFLNNSVISNDSPRGSGNSLSEQSMFIDSLARKYLHKATTDLERINQSTSVMDSLDYNGNSGDQYYSSIRMPDGRAGPTKRCAISSTPAPHYNQISVACKKRPENGLILDRDTWSGVRILEGLDQQPSILQAAMVREEEWQQSGLSSDNMVLDLDRLRLLPKYL